MAASPQLVDVFKHDHAGLHRNSKEGQHAHARRHAEVGSRNQQGQEASHTSQANVQQNEQRPFVGTKHGIENDEDHKDGQRDDQGQPRLRAFFALVFARPAEAVAAWQFHLFADLIDRIFDRCSQIAASHVERYRHVPDVAFTKNVVCAVFDVDAGQLRQGHALPRGREQTNSLDGLLRITVGSLVANGHVVALLSDQYLTHRVAADGSLDGVLYIGNVDSKASGFAAVDRQVEIGLAEIAQELDVVHARDVRHHGSDF